MTRLAVALAVAALLVALAGPGLAVQPDEMLSNPVLEARARDLSRELRCLVCQNQSIDDSNAALARDLRVLVRERLNAGDSDREVLDYVVARYGDFVLLRPPFKAVTVLLWAGPALIVGCGVLAVVVFFRRQRRLAVAGRDQPLTAEERARVRTLLGDDAR
jgi:cytochrome c-type biogenesis protein CcmH